MTTRPKCECIDFCDCDCLEAMNEHSICLEDEPLILYKPPRKYDKQLKYRDGLVRIAVSNLGGNQSTRLSNTNVGPDWDQRVGRLIKVKYIRYRIRIFFDPASAIPRTAFVRIILFQDRFPVVPSNVYQQLDILDASSSDPSNPTIWPYLIKNKHRYIFLSDETRFISSDEPPRMHHLEYFKRCNLDIIYNSPLPNFQYQGSLTLLVCNNYPNTFNVEFPNVQVRYRVAYTD